MLLESKYQARLIKRIERMFRGCFIIKIPTDLIQGLPDLLILYRDRWAVLEVKTSANADHQPNQDYYIGMFAEMSFAAFIYPENEEEILRGLFEAFERPEGLARFSGS